MSDPRALVAYPIAEHLIVHLSCPRLLVVRMTASPMKTAGLILQCLETFCLFNQKLLIFVVMVIECVRIAFRVVHVWVDVLVILPRIVVVLSLVASVKIFCLTIIILCHRLHVMFVCIDLALRQSTTIAQ